jgi:hypothetical protein
MTTYNDYDDYMRGRLALQHFHNAMVMYYPSNYKITFQELIEILSNRPMQKHFIEGIGLGIEVSKLTDKSVNASMTSLALKSGGKLPADNNVFKQSLINSAMKIDWIDMPVSVIKDTTADIIKGAKAVGDSVIEGGKGINDLIKNINVIIPAVLIVGLVAFIFANKRG